MSPYFDDYTNEGQNYQPMNLYIHHENNIIIKVEVKKIVKEEWNHHISKILVRYNPISLSLNYKKEYQNEKKLEKNKKFGFIKSI